MRHFFRILKNRLTGTSQQKTTFAVARPKDLHVMMPQSVVLPLPKTPRDEISVPASINGRDLSTGRL